MKKVLICREAEQFKNKDNFIFIVFVSKANLLGIFFYKNTILFVCLFVWVLWYIDLCRLFYAKSIFRQINNSISNNSV